MRGLWLFACAALVSISLSACSFSGPETGGQAAAPAQAGQATSDVQPQATTMDTFRALAPPEGLKFTPLFAEDVSDDDARFRRLEQAVQSMKNDFDTVMPSITRLVSVEKDINELVGQLQTLTNGGQVEAEPLGLQEKLDRIPREDNAGGTENAAASTAATSLAPDTSRVTPEAASTGQLPPDGAASPSSSSASVPASAAPAKDDYVASVNPLDLKRPGGEGKGKSKPMPLPVVAKPVTPPTAQAATPTPAPVVVKMDPVISPAPVVAPVSAPAATGPVIGNIKSVRIGDHMDKTRIVLDMSAKADFTATLQNNGKQLVIDIPQMGFIPAKTWDALSAALVSGYHYEGSKLILDLLYPSEIKSQTVLTPNGSSDYRLVIDLFSKAVHQ